MNNEVLRCFFSSEAGIAFTGAIAGGVLALIGAVATIIYYRKKDKKDSIREDNRNISGFYYLMLSKVNLLRKWIEVVHSEPFTIQVTPIYAEEENMFLFNRLQSVLKVEGDSTVRELLTFMSDLQQLENARSECLKELQIRRTVSNYDKNNYIQLLIHCNKKLLEDKEKDLVGIVNILDCMEKYTKNV